MISNNLKRIPYVVVLALSVGLVFAVSYSADMTYATDSDVMKDKNTHMTSVMAQYKSGMSLDKIECKESRTLYIRNGLSPVCVKETTYQVLLERGIQLEPLIVHMDKSMMDDSEKMDKSMMDDSEKMDKSMMDDSEKMDKSMMDDSEKMDKSMMDDSEKMDKISKLNLTADEMSWLESNSEIRVAYDSNWPPFEYVGESGELLGLTPQIMSDFENALKIDFVPVESMSNWTATLESLKDRTTDVAFMIVDTPERRDYLGFTSPYLIVSSDIITTGSDSLTLDDLSSMNVGTIRDYSIESWLDTNHPEIKYISVDNVQSGIEMLQSGDIDVFLEHWGAVSHAVNSMGVDDLHNAGPSGYTYDLSIGYRSDQPVLGSLLQKTLDVSDVEYSHIDMDKSMMDDSASMNASGFP